jgi:hypothetical protein
LVSHINGSKANLHGSEKFIPLTRAAIVLTNSGRGDNDKQFDGRDQI